MLEGMIVAGYNIGTVDNFNGNTQVAPKYNESQREVVNQIENKPYGFIGFPENNTSAISVAEIVMGYVDNRTPYNISNLVVGGSAIYTSSSNCIINPNSVSINVKKDDNNINLEIGQDGLKFQDEYLSKFPQLKTVIDNLVSAINKVNSAISGNTPADITSEISNINNALPNISTGVS